MIMALFFAFAMRLSYSVFGSLFLLPAWTCSMFILMHFSQVCICTTVILDQKLFSICDVPQFFLGGGDENTKEKNIT